MQSFTVFLVLVSFCIWECNALSCPCWDDPDRTMGEKPTNCPSGVTTDACGCSYECARSLAEECGGPWNVNGMCGTNLQCLRAYSEEEDPNSHFNSDGICVTTAVYNNKAAVQIIRQMLRRRYNY